MPGPPTELSSRLEPARRQFFQWHLVEKRKIPEVKAKMDKLTKDLRIAGYDFDFIAEYVTCTTSSTQSFACLLACVLLSFLKRPDDRF